MPLYVTIPGRDSLELEYLLLDLNGTLTDRGGLIDGVAPRIARLRARLQVSLASADTFGTLDEVADRLDLPVERAPDSESKLRILERLGPDRSAVVGNGANDASILEKAALGIVVLGPEGANIAALLAADVVCGSILDALDLLLDERALAATLRR